MVYFFYCILILEVFFFSLLERKFLKTFFTPTLLLGYPFIFVVFLLLIFGKILEFKELSYAVIVFWIIGILIFQISFIFVAIVFNKVPVKKIAPIKLSQNNRQLYFIGLSVIFLVLFTGFLPWYNSYGFTKIGTEEFITAYGGGFSGHILNIAILMVIYIIGTIKKTERLKWLLLLSLYLLIALQQVKTWMFIPLIGGVLFRVFTGKMKSINIKFLVVIAVVSFFFFYIAYYFSTNLSNSYTESNYLLFVFNYFMYYLFAGVLGFSEWVAHNMIFKDSIEYLLSPFVTIASLFTDIEKINVVNPNFYIINKQGYISNVRTIFGSILENAGIAYSIIYLFIVSSSIYFLYFLALIRQNLWLFLLLAFVLSPLFVGVFDFYYNNLALIEIPVYIYVLYLLSMSKKTNHREIENN